MKIKLLSKSLVAFCYKTVLGHDFELMIHALEFVNDSLNDIEISNISLSLASGDAKICTKYLTGKKLEAEIKNTGKYYNQSVKVPEALALWLSKMVSKDSFCAVSSNVAANECIVIGKQFFHINDEKPTKLIVEVNYSEQETAKSTCESFSLNEYQLKNKYILPLKGNIWGLLGPAHGTSPHRQLATQEFGYDFIILDQNGIVHSGEGKNNSDYYCFKKEIIAPAAGKIITVKNGIDENTELNKTPDFTMERLKKWGFLHLLGGNFIVIEHENSEYSFFAHCAKDSIMVKEGQEVAPGQPIALLGNTGNSTAPHLHFHLMDGPEPLTSRSLPIKFENTKCYPWESGEEIISFWGDRDPMVRTF